MQPSDSPDLKVRRVRKLNVCPLCLNTGTVLRGLVQARCSCEHGSLFPALQRDGVAINPADYLAVFGKLPEDAA